MWSNLANNWIKCLLQCLIKNGNFIKYSNFINQLCKVIFFKFKDISDFFEKINKNIILPVTFLERRVAGKKTLIPVRIKKDKEIKFAVRLIISHLKYRTERNFFDRLFNELIDVAFNKGLSIKKRGEICKEISNNRPNLRFLRKR